MDLAVPDYSTLSRCGKGLRITPLRRAASKPITLIVDSTCQKNAWRRRLA
ncbi:transposase [uncultured Tateyamaria sp.]